jgi:membrane-bound lytic murein transglycosylase A
LAAAIVAALAGSASGAPMNFPDAEIEPLAWSDLEGWAADDHEAAFTAFLASCKAVVNGRKPLHASKPIFPPLKSVCRKALKAFPLEREAARAFFEANFRPVRISRLGDPAGFLTGYYEPIAEGSRVPTPEFTVPMHRRPGDLVALGRRKPGGFPNSGKVKRRLGKGKFADYFDRAAIEDGALAGRKLEICYLKDPIDAFFIHIQGSARVRLEDGSTLRLNYDAHNGHRYTPVGRILIERDLVPKEEMSMQRIRQWMLANPEEGRELRRKNQSYIFFRVTQLSDHDEAVGAQGVPLTPGRSIAVDKALHAYGTPFWIEAGLPIASETSSTAFRRLLIAQDTGSAIVGPARADIYFGAGDEAAEMAGRIRHPGRFVMLVPREIDPATTGKGIPLPRPRPQAPAPVARAGEAEPAASAGKAVPAKAARRKR